MSETNYVPGGYPDGSPKQVVSLFMRRLLGYTDTKSYDEDGMNNFVTDDIELHLPGTRPDTPWAGTYKGRAGFDEFWAICAEHLDIFSHVVEHMIAEDEKVVVISHEKFGSHVTGRVGEQKYAWLFQLRDGKVWYWRLFEDTEAIAHCFGR
ncbi:MAG: nuclear transport factor 2 family protein [Sphingomonadaceae bacterium]